MSMPETNGHGPHRPPPPSLESLQQEFARLLADNKEKLAEMARQGTPADSLSFTHSRIDSLIESISRFAGPDGPRWAIVARLDFERSVAREIEAAASQGRRAQLALGARLSPGQIAELARQSGIFRKRA
jgi:hypothetical protein